MSASFTEADIYNEITNLMSNSQFKPEPEIECFSKYFASRSGAEFQSGNEMYHLINSHGIHVKNEVRYWLGRRKNENDTSVPVLEVEAFDIKDFIDVKSKLKELPSEWTIIQVTKSFSVNDVLREKLKKSVLGIHILRFSCGKLAERIQPYSVFVDQSNNNLESVFELIKSVAKTRNGYFSHGKTSKKLYDEYQKTNSELKDLIKELETNVLNKWACLFKGRLEDENLERETRQSIKKLIEVFCKNTNMKNQVTEVQLDIIYQVSLCAHFMKNEEILGVLKSVLFGSGISSVNIMELKLLMENIKILNLKKECALKRAECNPVILILDKEFENVSWEMITPLLGRPVCRIASLQLLYALFQHHKRYIKNGFRIVDIDCAYGLINPGKDLDACEKRMKEFFKNRLPWVEVTSGCAPDPKTLLSKIGECSTYVYCGHGTGLQYMKVNDLKKKYIKGLVLLFGCSSNVPKTRGGRTPYQNNVYTYILNGCPCVIGCMQDIGTNDADSACEKLLSEIMPSIEVKGLKKIVQPAKEPNVLKSLAYSREACFRYWSKSALVARGIPCKTAVGKINTRISNCM